MDGTVTTENVLKGKLISIPEIDTTLTKSGYSAEAKATGDAINTLANRVNDLEVEGGGVALGVGYDNTASGLSATTVQGAIDETLQSMFDKNEGGMVEGNVSVRNADNGYGTLMKNNSSTADYGTQVEDISAGGKSAKITVNASTDQLTFTDSSSNINDIYHDGNKAFSYYSGNGSATARKVDTKGKGKLLLVYSTNYLAFVTPKGAVVVTLSNGGISWVGSGVAYYVDGELTISTTNGAFNTSNETYYYQVV